MNYSGGCQEAPSVACRDNAAPRGLRRALLAPPQTSTVGRPLPVFNISHSSLSSS